MQGELESLEEPNPLSGKLRSAAEHIDPAAYREVAMALVAVDTPIGAAARLGDAIALARSQDCKRHFLAEYGQLAWEHITETLAKRGAE
jgi:hypothetical protein